MMFIVVDDRIINLDDISLVEPDAEHNTLSLYYRTENPTATTLHYDNTRDMVDALTKLVAVTRAQPIPGTITESQGDIF